MPSTPLHELIPVLQVAIGPVILISGVGLLLLTLTNRFGRIIDLRWWNTISGNDVERIFSSIPTVSGPRKASYRASYCVILYP